jgi:hypothetical protein
VSGARGVPGRGLAFQRRPVWDAPVEALLERAGSTARFVMVPGDTGVLLARGLVLDPTNMPDVQDARANTRCERVTD